ncbi:unnamed protein product [Ilex paraguariensis]|uniref:Uncharacterized protein n=1 Tax=Ilex paraguariensis TaxID=185542 RepID=A0ABC8S1D0_9AQUA
MEATTTTIAPAVPPATLKPPLAFVCEPRDVDVVEEIRSNEDEEDGNVESGLEEEEDASNEIARFRPLCSFCCF